MFEILENDNSNDISYYKVNKDRYYTIGGNKYYYGLILDKTELLYFGVSVDQGPDKSRRQYLCISIPKGQFQYPPSSEDFLKLEEQGRCRFESLEKVGKKLRAKKNV